MQDISLLVRPVSVRKPALKGENYLERELAGWAWSPKLEPWWHRGVRMSQSQRGLRLPPMQGDLKPELLQFAELPVPAWEQPVSEEVWVFPV